MVKQRISMKASQVVTGFLAVFVLTPLYAQELSWGELEKQFDTLPMEARRLTGPLFWMHGDETRAQLEGELQKVLEGGNGTFTAEPRPHKDWLGEGWYRDVAINLDFARKNDLTMFIYDDWWWPSQMMGGRVPPQYGSKRLVATDSRVEGPKAVSESGYGDTNLIKVVAGRVIEGGVDSASLVDLTASVRNGTLTWSAPAGTWSVMIFTWVFNGTKGGQQKYISVDGADPACVDWFINTVYQPHYDRFKSDFGKTITGYFYDEPETQGDWGSDFPKLVAERNLDLNKLLVAYKFKLAGDVQTAAYYSYLDTFAESWGRTMYGGMSRWCREHKVVSMGHFMEHGNDIFSRGMSGGNMMQLLKYSDMGGMDLVCNQLQPGNRNMGVYQMPKMASSVSHTYNKANDIAFCEIFGGYNQGLTYPTMKWLTDWHQVRGVNFLIPHSFNPRAPYDRDYPPYFYNGGQEPRWPLYRVWADYNNRLSLLLVGGRHVAPVALLHLGQSYHVGAKQRPEELTSALQDAQFDCDWLQYDAWEKDAKLDNKAISLHKENYQVLVLPAVEVIPYPTLAKARAFFDKGGVVLAYGMLPSKSATLGHDSKEIADLCDALWGTAKPGLTVCKSNAAGGRSYFLPEKPTPAELQKVLTEDAGIRPALEVVSGDTGNWLHVLHRQKAGRDVFLICNQNFTGVARPFTFRAAVKGVPEIWDPMRNEIASVASTAAGKGTEFSLTLEPSESVVVVFQDKDRKLPRRMTAEMKPQGEIPVRDTPQPEDVKAQPEKLVAVKPPSEKLVVVKATYGVPGDAQRSRDVKKRLQERIDAGERLLPVVRLADGDDPAFGVVKRVEAECTSDGKTIILKGSDTDTLILSANPTAQEQAGVRDAAGRHVTRSPAKANPFDGTCTIPADLNLAKARVYLEVDDLVPEAAARVTVNGRFAGGFIGKPLRLNVTRVLKAGPNTIRLDPFAPKSARLVVNH
jgi:hypothetical protein